MIVSTLFSSSKNCLSLIRQDVEAGLSIIKNIWMDETTLAVINQSTPFLSKEFDLDCTGVCQSCLVSTSQFFKELGKVGIDEVLFNLILERKKIKNKTKIASRDWKTECTRC